MSKFDLSDDRNVTIIGSGAAGGTLADVLTAAGVSVILLEAGREITPDEFVRDEWAGAEMFAWSDERRSSGSWRLGRDYPTRPVWHSKALGGTSMEWMGVCLRFRDHEFRPRETYGDVAGADLIDWPISPEDLAPYYDEAERRMMVAGLNGLPQHPPSRQWRLFEKGAAAAGYNDIIRSPLAMLAEQHGDRGPNTQDGFTLHGDRSKSKWSTSYVEIPRALATGRLDLRTKCRATEIETDTTGRVSAVIYVDEQGQRRRQATRFAIVAGNSIESPRLLLASRSGRNPNGLANGSDMVGRCYMRHVMGSVWSIFDKPVFMNRGEAMTGLVCDTVAHDPARGFAAGYYLQLNAISLPAVATALEPALWGRDLTYALERYASMSGVIVMGEDLPVKSNRITLAEGTMDRFGVPLANVHSDEHPNDTKMRNHAYKAMTALHAAAGAERSYETPPFPSTHNLGTLRMSQRPEEGVVNQWGIAHEVKNLMVAGGPIFTSSAAANPTLTIVALALRQAEAILTQLKH